MNDCGRQRMDWVVNIGRIADAKVSLAVACGLLMIHGLMEVLGEGGLQEKGFLALGLSRTDLAHGELWRCASYALLHGSWWHVGLNVLLVLAIGSRIEHIAGSRAAAWTMLAGVLAGGLFHVMLDPGLLVGFSGAAVALLLLLVTLSPGSRMLPLPISGKSLGLGIMLAALVLALASPSSGIPGVSWIGQSLWRRGLGDWFRIGHACHFGGGLAGWLVGRWILRPRVDLTSLRRARAAREAARQAK